VAGNHALRAYYSGDSSFGPDKSAVLLQKVNAITGNGFSEGVNYPAGDPTSNSPSSIVTADFNDDDQADIAFANGNGVLCVFLGSGNGTFTPVGNSEDGEPVGYIEAVAAGDFNGDSVQDLAITSYKNGLAVSVLIGNGDGTFTNAGSLVTPNSLFSQSIRVADFNHDGNADIAIAGWNANGLVEVFLGNGNASFQNPVDYRVDLYPYAVAVSDFNGDGKADLAVTGGYGVSVLSGNGDGTFTPPQTFSTGVRPTTVEVGDFNGDGNNDLVTTYEGGSLSVLLGNGDGTFQTAKVDNASHGGLSIAVSDYNGDGIADLALTNGVVTVSLGVGDGTFVDLNNSTGANAHLVAPGDFNSDGIADLAFASTNSLQILLGKPGLLQAITFDPLSDVNFGVPSFTINARASSGLPVSFSSTTTNVCAMNGATVSLVAIGNCSITASQAGDETYATALPVVRNFKVSLSTCDINLDENTNVADVQLIINEALGVIPASHDLNHDGTVNVADVQKVINAALGLGCVLP